MIAVARRRHEPAAPDAAAITANTVPALVAGLWSKVLQPLLKLCIQGQQSSANVGRQTREPGRRKPSHKRWTTGRRWQRQQECDLQHRRRDEMMLSSACVGRSLEPVTGWQCGAPHAHVGTHQPYTLRGVTIPRWALTQRAVTATAAASSNSPGSDPPTSQQQQAQKHGLEEPLPPFRLWPATAQVALRTGIYIGLLGLATFCLPGATFGVLFDSRWARL